MSVTRRERVGAFVDAHIQSGESLLAWVEADVEEVNGRTGATADVDRVLLVLTDRRLLTLVRRGSAEPELDASVPLEYVASADTHQDPLGCSLVIRLSSGAWARFLVSAESAPEAEALSSSLPLPTLAGQLAALAARARHPVPELPPALTLREDAAANAYFVQVRRDLVPEGACPRCRHEVRLGAVFCDTCGALQ